MTALEIKKALECCYAYVLNDSDTENCRECPYITSYIIEPCFDKLIKDVLALLKEQEAVEPRYIDGKRNHIIKCGNCNTDLMSGMKYCPQCGKAVKWE